VGASGVLGVYWRGKEVGIGAQICVWRATCGEILIPLSGLRLAGKFEVNLWTGCTQCNVDFGWQVTIYSTA
jgi:hypothetical protein